MPSFFLIIKYGSFTFTGFPLIVCHYFYHCFLQLFVEDQSSCFNSSSYLPWKSCSSIWSSSALLFSFFLLFSSLILFWSFSIGASFYYTSASYLFNHFSICPIFSSFSNESSWSCLFKFFSSFKRPSNISRCVSVP